MRKPRRAQLPDSLLQVVRPQTAVLGQTRQHARADLLDAGIAAAGLDVFDPEPPQPDNPLFKLDNVVLTPHTASYADQTMAMQRRRVGRDALAVCRGGLPDFVANPEVLTRRRV